MSVEMDQRETTDSPQRDSRSEQDAAVAPNYYRKPACPQALGNYRIEAAGELNQFLVIADTCEGIWIWNVRWLGKGRARGQ